MVCSDWECAGYVECSAKTNDNLEAMLREMAKQAGAGLASDA